MFYIIDKLNKNYWDSSDWSHWDPAWNYQIICSMMCLLTVVISNVQLKLQFGFQNIRPCLQAHNTIDAAVTAHSACSSSVSQESSLSDKNKNNNNNQPLIFCPFNFLGYFFQQMTSTVSNSLYSTWQKRRVGRERCLLLCHVVCEKDQRVSTSAWKQQAVCWSLYSSQSQQCVLRMLRIQNRHQAGMAEYKEAERAKQTRLFSW